MIEIRNATKDDLEFMRVIRNADRGKFLDPRFITRKQQAEWWANRSPDTEWFIILYHGKRAGMYGVKTHCREDIAPLLVGTNLTDDFIYEPLSVIVQRSFRGKGIMSAVYSLMFSNPNRQWIGQVVYGNDRIMHVDTKAGFKPVKIILERT
jgi:GNAT superfamily N-acetyltransferase